MVIRVERYAKDKVAVWNQFVEHSKNGTFLFNRAYMDYHADRFEDHSLLFYRDDALVALLPANNVGNELYSHQGLTYGGMITDRQMRAPLMLEIFDALLAYGSTQQFQAIHYKAIPHIYHAYPAEEDIYALFRMGAKLTRVDVSTTIPLANWWGLHPSKKSGVNKAKKSGLVIRRSEDFDGFFAMTEARLMERYSTSPVHSAAEMKLLASRFPDNIKLLCAYKEERMIAGTVTYNTDRVIHTQYIASTEEGRELRAVDAVIAELIEQSLSTHAYFDFGISNEQQGKVLNTGLVSQKEEFGGRAIVHQTYTWSLI